jgi:hypothetical protein
MKKKQKMALYGLTPVLVGLALASSASADTISASASMRGAVKGFKSKMHSSDGVRNNTAIAGILGITSTELQTALQSGKTIDTLIAEKGLDKNKVMQSLRAAHEAQMEARIKSDIASGKLTQIQADQMKTNHTMREVKHKEALATALGISVATLDAEIQSGATMAGLAAAHSLTEDTLKTKLDAARDIEMKTDLRARVVSGKFTQAEADSILANKGKGGKRGFGGEHRPRSPKHAKTTTTQ